MQLSHIATAAAQGFILLLYWSLYEIPIGFAGTFGTFLKLLASVFFNIQPASGLIEMEELGVPWSNFVGICLFHTGNVVSCYSMIGMFDKSGESMTLLDIARTISYVCLGHSRSVPILQSQMHVLSMIFLSVQIFVCHTRDHTTAHACMHLHTRKTSRLSFS